MNYCYCCDISTVIVLYYVSLGETPLNVYVEMDFVVLFQNLNYYYYITVGSLVISVYNLEKLNDQQLFITTMFTSKNSILYTYPCLFRFRVWFPFRELRNLSVLSQNALSLTSAVCKLSSIRSTIFCQRSLFSPFPFPLPFLLFFFSTYKMSHQTKSL